MKRLGFLFAICIISGSIIFILSKIDKTVIAENQVKTESQLMAERSLNNHDSHLELIKRPFDPNLIEFYTGKIMKFKKCTLANVSDGVYVSGIQGHSRKQVFTIYSKDKTSDTEITKVKVDGNTLKVFLEDDKSKAFNEEHLVYQTQTSKMPIKYEVIRIGKVEKSEELFYAIE